MPSTALSTARAHVSRCSFLTKSFSWSMLKRPMRHTYVRRDIVQSRVALRAAGQTCKTCARQTQDHRRSNNESTILTNHPQFPNPKNGLCRSSSLIAPKKIENPPSIQYFLHLNSNL